MFSSRGTVRFEDRGQGYRDVEKVGKHCSRGFALLWRVHVGNFQGLYAQIF